MYVVVVSLLVFVELLIVAIGAVPLSLSSALRAIPPTRLPFQVQGIWLHSLSYCTYHAGFVC